MSTAIINPTTSAATSSEVEVTDTPVTINLNGTADDIGLSMVEVQIKTSSGKWITDSVLMASKPGYQIVATGTYRARKPVSVVAFGVDRG